MCVCVCVCVSSDAFMPACASTRACRSHELLQQSKWSEITNSSAKLPANNQPTHAHTFFASGIALAFTSLSLALRLPNFLEDLCVMTFLPLLCTGVALQQKQQLNAVCKSFIPLASEPAHLSQSELSGLVPVVSSCHEPATGSRLQSALAQLECFDEEVDMTWPERQPELVDLTVDDCSLDATTDDLLEFSFSTPTPSRAAKRPAKVLLDDETLQQHEKQTKRVHVSPEVRFTMSKRLKAGEWTIDRKGDLKPFA